MALSIKSGGDLLVVSRLKQSNATTAASLAAPDNGALIEFNEGSGINVVDNRASNEDQKTGQVEPTEVDIESRSAEGTLAQDRATPDGLAWMFAMFTGIHTVTTIDAGPPAIKRHFSRLTAYPEEPAYFTCAHRKGGSGGAPAELRRHVGLGANTLRLRVGRGEFLQNELGVLGIGQYDDGVLIDEFDHDFATNSHALTRHPVGATDAEKASNVTLFADLDDDGYYEQMLVPTGYVNGTKVLTWTEEGVTGTHKLRAVYCVLDTETAYYGTPSWHTQILAAAVESEFKLKAGNIQLLIGAQYDSDSPPTKLGGQVAGCEVETLEYTGDWGGEAGSCWRTGAVATEQATQVDLGSVRQTFTVDRRVRDYLFHYHFERNEALGIYMDAFGPEIDPVGNPGERFHVKIYWPRVKFLEKPMQINDRRWVDSGSLVVLKDVTTGFPTVIFEVQNSVASYIA